MSDVNSRNALLDHEPNILKGLAAGAIGGLVASWVMDKFQYALMESSTTQAQESSNNSDSSEPATAKAAEIISEKIFAHHLTKDEKKIAGDAVHYGTGGTSAALYGVAAEFLPGITAGAGITFGTAVWLVVDEGAVPVLHLSKGPFKYPLSTHLYALVSHFVYGVTTEVVRRTLRSSLLR